MQIASRDLRKTLSNDLEGLLSLDIGEIICAKFRFTIEVDGKSEKVSFMIAPPYITDLAKKKHADIISAYLRENGVQLV